MKCLAAFSLLSDLMKTQKISIGIERRQIKYDVVIGSNVLSDAGRWARACLGKPTAKVAVITNKTVFGLYGEAVADSLGQAGFDVRTTLMGDGERFKTMRTLEKLLEFLAKERFTRTDAVIAFGGGVVGDAAGFAASIYLRGLPYLQVPTTLLSMIDSSVGGKTGVNTRFGKNLVGTFYQPRGVLIDVSTLETLPKRELTAGLCEALKQAAVSGTQSLFQTADVLKKFDVAAKPLPLKDLRRVIADQVAFKAAITADDEQESAENKGARSRKILNFGHTLAHALENVTKYRYLKHGEAVGYGVIFAAELSKKLGLLPANQVTLLNGVVRLAGKLPPIDHLEPAQIIAALGYDKKNVGGSLQWILLRGIGRPLIFPDKDIPRPLLTKTLESFLKVHGR